MAENDPDLAEWESCLHPPPPPVEPPAKLDWLARWLDASLQMLNKLNEGKEADEHRGGAVANLAVGKAYTILAEFGRIHGKMPHTAPTIAQNKKQIAYLLAEVRTVLAEGNFSGQKSELVAVPALSERQYDILEALLLMKATGPDKRRTAPEIATKAEGIEADPVGFKVPIAELKGMGLVDTKEGRGGGCWLTAKGEAIAKQISKR